MGMTSAVLLDELLDPFAECLDPESAQRVVEFRIAPSVQEVVDALAGKANEGVLTDEERAQYESLINAADLIQILKLKARHKLNSNTRP